MPRLSAHLNRIKAARAQLFDRGVVPEGLLPEPIERSWSRCVSTGQPGELNLQLAPLTQPELNEIREKNSRLLDHARPEMENLQSQIIGTHSMVILTDANGTILHALGDPDFVGKAQRVALQPGVSWSEENTGTNAIGTSLVEQQPVFVAGAEHYFEQNGFLNCSAAPIFSPQGEVVGVLDVSGDYRQPQAHTLALVRMSAQMIENRLFGAEFSREVTVRFHTRPEFIGTLWEGIAVFSPEGRLQALNRSAMFLLGISGLGVGQQEFEALFEGSLPRLIDLARRSLPGSTSLSGKSGMRLYAKVDMAHPVVMSSPSAVEQVRHESHSEPEATSLLDALDIGDQQMRKAVAAIKKVLGRDIAILVEGETGTGKELLAKAIHMAQGRKGQFVAINCASIPEGLIEAELFGYEDGAFTGARRKGMSGRLLQANGGTLFLDEIGEMPMHLQARLLRVLQEREIVPLGGGKNIPVDFSLISATNRKLLDRVEKGLFREDLYYRLNGLRVILPPLRQRGDLEILVARILQEEATHLVALDAEVLQMLQRHPWRGNVRQLRNVLRASLAFLGSERLIKPQHLPDDFIEELDKSDASDHAQSVRIRLDSSSAEAERIRQAIQDCDGNMTEAARALGIGRATLYRKIKQMGIAG